MLRSRRFWLLFAAFAVHGALALLEARPQPRPLAGDEIRYAARAEAIARGETPEADLLWPPLYSEILAAAFSSGAGRAGVVVLQLLALGGTALLIHRLAARATGAPWAADLAAFFTFAYPPLAAFAYYLWPEVLHLVLLVGLAWILAERAERPAWQAAFGALLGLALLVKSLLTPFVPVALGVLALAQARGARARALARASALLALTVLPTLISHQRRAGCFVIADSSRFNLWLGLTDTEDKDLADERPGAEYRAFMASAPTFGERNRRLAERIRAFVAERGLGRVLADQLGRQYFRLLSKDSLLTDQLPGGRLAARGRGYRAAPDWLARALSILCDALWAGLLALSPLGWFVLLRRPSPWIAFAAAFTLGNLLLFLGFHVKSRYVVQLLPWLILAAVAALAWLVRRLWGQTTDQLPAWQPAAAALLAVLCEVLAFGGN